MELKKFLDNLNHNLAPKFKFFKAEWPKGHDDDPVIVVVNLIRGNVVAHFKFANDLVYSVHADCSFDELCAILDEIKRLLDGE